MASMSMIFTTDHSTPLYSSAWTPKTQGAYAGTCIFLVVLAVISRILLAYRHMLEQKWQDRAMNRRYIVVAGETEADRERQMMGRGGEKMAEATLTTRGLNERVKVIRSPRHTVQAVPWRFTTDLPRACIFTVQAGLGYLLMLAVMTLNVGYFLSVLAGLFVGEIAVGRYAQMEDAHH
ncbi:Ctr copper transporter [Teratosphaeria nubilosa]|uniref:Copper transport protein n=1 Tax=Teratosphaeria nubilosa TaxID=161662 RepID=A0A6G1LL28_9PEZI|nr:Ctr copper transporter [Teratosphaeria nubilosa]